MREGENDRKDGQSTTILSITERKTSDEESRSARKRIWKITPGVCIVFFSRIALKRPYNE